MKSGMLVLMFIVVGCGTDPAAVEAQASNTSRADSKLGKSCWFEVGCGWDGDKPLYCRNGGSRENSFEKRCRYKGRSGDGCYWRDHCSGQLRCIKAGHGEYSGSGYVCGMERLLASADPAAAPDGTNGVSGPAAALGGDSTQWDESAPTPAYDNGSAQE
jgi:hypothetical protein